MTLNDAFQLALVLVSVAGLLFGFFKWFSGWAEKRHEVHHERFNVHSKRIDATEQKLISTRDEMHRDFVRTAALETMRAEFQKDFEKLFQMVGALSKDLNQMIGEMRSKGGKK